MGKAHITDAKAWTVPYEKRHGVHTNQHLVCTTLSFVFCIWCSGRLHPLWSLSYRAASCAV